MAGGAEPLIERTGGAAAGSGRTPACFGLPGLIHQLGETPEQGPLHPGQGKSPAGAGHWPTGGRSTQVSLTALFRSHITDRAPVSPEPARCPQPPATTSVSCVARAQLARRVPAKA